jgi:DNA repair protein RecO (recombination protein O)
MSKILLEPAFVLHSKAYRETSLLVDCFTKNHGRIFAVAKSARGMRSRFKGCLLPFAPLLVSFAGKTELLQMTAVETEGLAYTLRGDNLFNGLYLNELLIKLLPKHDPAPNLFLYYQEVLGKLQDCGEPQVTLQLFEKQLLAELGYGLQLNKQATGKKILPECFYTYDLEQGLVPCYQHNGGFQGSHLLAIEKNDFATAEILKDARKLIRMVLSMLLQDRIVKSRELFT